MSQLIFTPPGKDAPGFLRRQRDALQFQQTIKAGNFGPELVDQMIALLLPFVESPADRAEAAEMLLDASEAQFETMLKAVQGVTPNPTSAAMPGANSDSGTVASKAPE